MIEINDSAAVLRGSMFELNENAYEGFRQAVTNNQLRLALEYAVEIINAQKTAISELEDLTESLRTEATEKAAKVEELEKEVEEKPVAKKASSRKTTSRTRKTSTSNDEESD